MRIGNMILFLLLVFIGFGFLLHYSIDLAHELDTVNYQLAKTQVEMQALEEKYQTLLQENQHLNAQVASLTEQNSFLQAQLTLLESERITLYEQASELQARLSLIEQMHPLLTWVASLPLYKLVGVFMIPVMPITFGVIYAVKRRRFVVSDKFFKLQAIRTELTPNQFHLLKKRQSPQRLRRFMKEEIIQRLGSRELLIFDTQTNMLEEPERQAKIIESHK